MEPRGPFFGQPGESISMDRFVPPPWEEWVPAGAVNSRSLTATVDRGSQAPSSLPPHRGSTGHSWEAQRYNHWEEVKRRYSWNIDAASTWVYNWSGRFRDHCRQSQESCMYLVQHSSRPVRHISTWPLAVFQSKSPILFDWGGNLTDGFFSHNIFTFQQTIIILKTIFFGNLAETL